MSSKQAEAPDPRVYGFNPISHHYVKKTGAVWLRLVKAGMAEDSELMQQIKDKALTRKKAGEEKKAPVVKKAPKPRPKSASTVEHAKIACNFSEAARKLVKNNRSELDDLESDAVVEQIRKLKLKRSTLADSTVDGSSESESSDEEPEPVSRKPRRPSTLTDRIRLKSQPIPIPDRRAALRQSLDQPIESEDD